MYQNLILIREIREGTSEKYFRLYVLLSLIIGNSKRYIRINHRNTTEQIIMDNVIELIDFVNNVINEYLISYETVFGAVRTRMKEELLKQ